MFRFVANSYGTPSSGLGEGPLTEEQVQWEWEQMRKANPDTPQLERVWNGYADGQGELVYEEIDE